MAESYTEAPFYGAYFSAGTKAEITNSYFTDNRPTLASLAALMKKEKREYNGVAIGPSASFMMDNVNIIIYPVEYPKTQMAKDWEGRKTFESTKGRAVDHLGFSVDNLDAAMARLKKDGVKVTDEQLETVNVRRAKFHGEWNYTIHPTREPRTKL